MSRKEEGIILKFKIGSIVLGVINDIMYVIDSLINISSIIDVWISAISIIGEFFNLFQSIATEGEG